jgi:hypothetical protein
VSTAVEQAMTDLIGVVKTHGKGSLYAMLSPMMACEEAWLLGQVIRQLDPQAVLVLGPVPTTGSDEVFKNPANGRETFRIKAEKVPNAAGVRRVMQLLGGPSATFTEFAAGTKPPGKVAPGAPPPTGLQKLKAGWIVGGYLSSWLPADLPPLFRAGGHYRVVQDILPNALTDAAEIVIPAAAWAEKDGCWENHAGRIQAFASAIAPPEGAVQEGDVYYRILGRAGLYNARTVRAEMGEPFSFVTVPARDAQEPAFEFVEL